ncbi:MAG: CHC2 zinc finger domain-containing protein [Candidatus Eremiobacterota bacterium]
MTHPNLNLSRAELDDLKARIDLAEVFRTAGVELKRSGQSLVGRCPFHPDEQPSLSVTPEKGLWQCFGCQAGGDVLELLQRLENLEFPEAVRRVQELAGAPELARRGPKPASAGPEALPGNLSRAELLGRVADLYHEALFKCPQAQDYLKKRGLGDRELWSAFRLGYADGALKDLFPAQGEVAAALSELGVVNQGRELMRGCIVVPLGHPDHSVLNLYGRAVQEGSQVPHRYLRGPRRGVLNWQALRSSSRLVVAESVLDALSLWVAGVRDVTCLYGVGGLPPDLEELLLRASGLRELVWCLDADPPGRQAFLKWSGKLGGRFVHRTVELPDGQDPNAVLVSAGPLALAELVQGAVLLQAREEAAPSEPPEDDEESLRRQLDDVSYHLTPLPPFYGRLRVVLRAERQGRNFAGRLDFLVLRMLDQVGMQLSRRLGLSKEAAERHLAALMQETERWVKERHPRAQAGELLSRPAPSMSEQDKEEALDFLKRPDLVESILADMDALGYVGEETPKLLAYLIGISRKLEEPLAGIILSQSSAGKSALTEVIEKLTPEEEMVLYSRVTAQAISNHERTALKRKLLILAEKAGGGDSADYQIRELLSRQLFITAVPEKDPATGQIQTQVKKVEGPISYLETTASLNVNYENATRCFEIELDESVEQTRRIHQAQKARYRLEERAGQDHSLLQRRHRNAQRLLSMVAVIIPYVDHIRFPDRWLRTRRDHKRFLCLIEAVAFLHQVQRSGGRLPDGTAYIEATLADYRVAFELARKVLRSTFHELSRSGRDLWEVLLPWAREKAGERLADFTFTRKDIRALVDWPDKRVLEALTELADMEYLFVASGNQGRAYHYVVQAVDGQHPCPLRDLTPPEELERLGVR